ncbi:uncharacterized protein LOC131233044 [Magnolia sinica]|uniref:uncharacterized protein LOC131233044 n=1 Tax=Magnolia sinica TaxID=86752 RepID=UPI00265B0ECB|nr:uncharacterized protein LOC131233044 [Magnolia sinica]
MDGRVGFLINITVDPPCIPPQELTAKGFRRKSASGVSNPRPVEARLQKRKKEVIIFRLVKEEEKAMVRKKKEKKSKKKRKISSDQISALKSIHEWVSLDYPPPPPSDDDFQVPKIHNLSEPLVFDLHSHSTCSDGFLSPSALVQRAHRNGVKVLALTDHDTMAGIPEAVKAALKFGIRIIPGVEISTVYFPRGESGAEEYVHILAYYGCCGPASFEELEHCLANIRDGRYLRAKNMLTKLNNLRMPLKWEHVMKIAGNGVAPGRLHVARAMVEAGHVENVKQAFNRYLYDGGPAYASGSEPLAEEVVQMICRTGGVAALAHPWALKNPVAVIRSLKTAGLHAMEVYRSDGKVEGFSDLANDYDLLKLGGSDYHGRGGHDESDLGSINLPVLVIHEFLKLARPIWCNAMKDILLSFAEEPSNSNLEKILRFGRIKNLNADITLHHSEDVVDLCLSSWLTDEERQAVEFEALRQKLSHTAIDQGGFQMSVTSR